MRLCRRPAPAPRSLHPWDSNAPFTQEEFPGLLPEACAFFNTPLEDLDPELLHRSLAVFASKVADLLPPESGMPGAEALYATLCGHLAPQLKEPAPYVPPQPAPPTATEAPPEAPPLSPDPQPPQPPPEPPNASPAEQLASPPPPRAKAPARPRPIEAHLVPIAATATREIASPPAATPAPRAPARRPVPNRGPSFRNSTKQHPRRAHPRRHAPQPAPLRHWCYAARASPA